MTLEVESFQVGQKLFIPVLVISEAEHHFEEDAPEVDVLREDIRITAHKAKEEAEAVDFDIVLRGVEDREAA